MDTHTQSLIERIAKLEDELALEQARRVHLRDNASKAKGKAYNILNDGVLCNLNIASAALNRDKPKIEVALYQLSLAIELINKELPWFTK